jgi:hypothetical protein
MSRVINIDEKLAARSTVEREPVQITFRGRNWTFLSAMPAELPELLADGKIVASLLLAIEPDQREDFRGLNLNIDEAQVILEAFGDIFGVSGPES